MGAHFPRKALATRDGVLPSVFISCSILMLFHKCASAECRELRSLAAYVSTCFDKSTVCMHCNASASDFISVVFIR